MDIIERFENGERKFHIARDLGMNESTIRTIIKRKEELKRFEMIDNYTEYKFDSIVISSNHVADIFFDHFFTKIKSF